LGMIITIAAGIVFLVELLKNKSDDKQWNNELLHTCIMSKLVLQLTCRICIIYQCISLHIESILLLRMFWKRKISRADNSFDEMVMCRAGCKIHLIPILMHQMRISTTYVSSVMLRPKMFEIRNVRIVRTRKNLNRMLWSGYKEIQRHKQWICLFVWLFIAARTISQLSGGCHHYLWHGCKFRPMLSTFENGF
jgi:hypothetical protein